MLFDLDLELGVQASKEEIVKKFRAKSPILVKEQVEGDKVKTGIFFQKKFLLLKKGQGHERHIQTNYHLNPSTTFSEHYKCPSTFIYGDYFIVL